VLPLLFLSPHQAYAHLFRAALSALTRVVRMAPLRRWSFAPRIETSPSYTPDMSQTKTERSNCQFAVQQTLDRKVLVVVQLLHWTIRYLKHSVVGCDLLAS